MDEQTTEAITELLRQAEAGERWKLPRKSDPEVEVPEELSTDYGNGLSGLDICSAYQALNIQTLN